MTDDRHQTRAELLAQIRAAAGAIDHKFTPHGHTVHPFVTLKPEEHTRECWAGVLGLTMLGRMNEDAETIAQAANARYNTDATSCTCRANTAKAQNEG